MALNEKQSRFIDSYIQNPNATAAAIAAGYSPKTAYSIGEENLRKPEIAQAIAERVEELKTERTADIEEVLTFLTATMRGEVAEVATLPDGSSVSIPPKIVHRLRAADLLAKLQGAYLASTPEPSERMSVASLLGLADEMRKERMEAKMRESPLFSHNQK